MGFPKLPGKAAYLVLDNLPTRNVLNDLRQQLLEHNTPLSETAPLLLPEFRQDFLGKVFRNRHPRYRFGHDRDRDRDLFLSKKYDWLRDVKTWQKRRHELPQVLILRSNGPEFSAGGDENFDMCADVTSLIRQSPIPVVGVIQGLATATGAQLALATDLPVALPSAQFRLPGMSTGLPCISASAVLSRKFGNALTYRMLALETPIYASHLPPGTVELVHGGEKALEDRVLEIANRLAKQSPAQALAQAVAKWAFWTQAEIPSYSAALRWATMAMTVPARIDGAQQEEESFY